MLVRSVIKQDLLYNDVHFASGSEPVNMYMRMYTYFLLERCQDCRLRFLHLSMPKNHLFDRLNTKHNYMQMRLL